MAVVLLALGLIFGILQSTKTIISTHNDLHPPAEDTPPTPQENSSPSP